MLRISLLYTTRDLRSLRSSVRGRHGRLFSFYFSARSLSGRSLGGRDLSGRSLSGRYLAGA